MGRKGRDGAAAALASGDTAVPVARIVYIPRSLLEQVRVFRAAEGLTNTTVVLLAINATHRRLDDLAVAHSAPDPAAGDLFAVTTTKPVTTAMEITPTGAQLQVMDDPVAGCPHIRDRSHMVTVALTQFLADGGVVTNP